MNKTLKKVNSKITLFLKEKHVIKHIPTNSIYQCISFKDEISFFYLRPKNESFGISVDLNFLKNCEYPTVQEIYDFFLNNKETSYIIEKNKENLEVSDNVVVNIPIKKDLEVKINNERYEPLCSSKFESLWVRKFFYKENCSKSYIWVVDRHYSIFSDYLNNALPKEILKYGLKL